MSYMRFTRAGFLGVFAMAIMVLVLPGQGVAANRATQTARGRYLVDEVAKCGDCHSPHNAMGQVVSGKDLSGAKLVFVPLHPVPGWAAVAPPIAGLPSVTTDQAMRLLTMGIAPTGKPPAPPMPVYRMSHADAAAIVAYLRSLKPAGN